MRKLVLNIIMIFFVLSQLFIGNNISAQCVNADFSLGDFTNWTGSVGENQSGVYAVTGISMVPGTSNTISYATALGRQTIMNQPNTDPNTANMLSVLPPNGSSSCRLGNPRTAGCDGSNPQAERIEYSYMVTDASRIFMYQYAVVLQLSEDNPLDERPKFTIYILDSLCAIVNSTNGYYEVIASTGISGFITCQPAFDDCKTDNVVWKDWTSVDVDLSDYIGQNVKVQFTTYDCDPGNAGGYFGYAYISCSCGMLNDIIENDNNSFIQIFPNPGKGIYTLTLGNIPGNDLNIEIYNSLGGLCIVALRIH